MKSADTNEEKATFWIREKIEMDTELRDDFKRFLSTTNIREKSTIYRRRIMGFYLNLFAHLKSRALMGCLK